MWIGRLSTAANALPERLILICVGTTEWRLFGHGAQNWRWGERFARPGRSGPERRLETVPMKNWIIAIVVLALALAMYGAIIYKMS